MQRKYLACTTQYPQRYRAAHSFALYGKSTAGGVGTIENRVLRVLSLKTHSSVDQRLEICDQWLAVLPVSERPRELQGKPR